MGKTKVLFKIDQKTYLRLSRKKCIDMINMNTLLKRDEPDIYLELITLGVLPDSNIKVSVNYMTHTPEYFIRWRTKK